jgi:hypothetical protein
MAGNSTAATGTAATTPRMSRERRRPEEFSDGIDPIDPALGQQRMVAASRISSWLCGLRLSGFPMRNRGWVWAIGMWLGGAHVSVDRLCDGGVRLSVEALSLDSGGPPGESHAGTTIATALRTC